MSEIQRAWQKAQDAWIAAGATTPCYEEAYMAARKELADAYARADAKARRYVRSRLKLRK